VNVFAIRHSDTAWSLSGQHTRTRDIPLDLIIMREMRQLIGSSVKRRLFLAIDEKKWKTALWAKRALPVKERTK
jgi:hypothetical protein